MDFRTARLVGFSLVLACVATPGAASAAATQQAYYAGKTIRIVVPFSPGGVADVAGRLVARELGRHLAGNPTIVVENRTGAGGAVGVREVLQRPADGLSLLVITSGIGFRWLLRRPGHDYPLTSMPVLGGLEGSLVELVRRDQAPTVEALVNRREPIVSGHTDPAASGALGEKIAAMLLKFPVRQVGGFQGFGDVALALERGEVHATNPGDLAYVQTFARLAEADVIRPLFQSGSLDARGNVIRSPLLADVPTVEEAYRRIHRRDPVSEGLVWEAYRALVSVVTGEQVFLIHPRTPPERVSELQEAFTRMFRSAGWAETVQSVMGTRVAAFEYDIGEQILQRFTTTTDEVRDLLARAGSTGCVNCP